MPNSRLSIYSTDHFTPAQVRAMAERFWQKIDSSDSSACWDWRGALNSRSKGDKRNRTPGQLYGVIRLKSQIDGKLKEFRAHRVAWELHNTISIPLGILICHKCDRPICCNPYHLYLGTHQQNMKDMVERGRSTRGERNHSSRLTADQVREIRYKRMLGYTFKRLAEEYSVHLSTIAYVCDGTSWKHVD